MDSFDTVKILRWRYFWFSARSCFSIQKALNCRAHTFKRLTAPLLRYIIKLQFKVILWGGVQFPTGSIVCESRKAPNGCNSRTDGKVRMIKEFKAFFVLARPDFSGRF